MLQVSATAGTAGGMGLLCLLAYATGLGQSAMMWLGLRRRKGKVADEADGQDTEKMEEGDASTTTKQAKTTYAGSPHRLIPPVSMRPHPSRLP